jgi:hypothetical protein
LLPGPERAGGALLPGSERAGGALLPGSERAAAEGLQMGAGSALGWADAAVLGGVTAEAVARTSPAQVREEAG